MTQDNQMNQIPKTFAGTGHPLHHLVDGRAVATVELAADGIGEKFLGQAANKGFFVCNNEVPELVHG